MVRVEFLKLERTFESPRELRKGVHSLTPSVGLVGARNLYFPNSAFKSP